MQEQIIADRMTNYLKPQMYARFTQLAVQKDCVNLGQGFPNFAPPQFLRQALSEEALTENLQYTMTAGHPKLLKSGADFFSKNIGIQIDVAKEIVVSAGAQTVLACTFQGLVNPGEQVICLDPAFDFYRPLIEFTGATHIGVPIKPVKLNNKADLLKRFIDGKFQTSQDDEWKIDFEYLEKVLNPKTKMIVVNSPQNPIGKVFTKEELDKLADVLEKHPQVIVCEDAAYHHIAFGEYQPFSYPRCITHPRLKGKTVCVISAGKMFSATGLRVGFAIGDEKYIKGIKAAQTYHIFCLNPVLQTATARCLDQTIDGKYYQETRDLYYEQSQLLLKGLVDSRLNFNYWVPNGGYFIVTDISQVEIPEKYFTDPDDGKHLTRDFAFAHYVANEFRVVCIPCSPYYENKEIGQNIVRWAFCKTTETIKEACARLK